MTLLFCKRELSDETYNLVLSEFSKNRASDRYGAFGFGDIQAVPGLLSEHDKTRLNESVSLIASLAPIIMYGLNGNPRQIKRFLNTFTIRKRLVDIVNIQNFRIDILIKLMVLEYSNLSFFKTIYDWQLSQSGEPRELVELEKLAQEDDIDELKKHSNSSDWPAERMMKWLMIEPFF